MKRKAAALLVAGIAAVVLVAAPTIASAKRMKDNPNYGFCKSGAKVKDIKACKENGGKK